MKLTCYILSISFLTFACGQAVQGLESSEPKTPPHTQTKHIKVKHQDSSVIVKKNTDILKPVMTLASKITGPKQVSRWEPSGIVSSADGIWVVSDREGWITYYKLPLNQGDNQPTIAHKLSPKLENRIKWEGLEWERNQEGQITALLLLEAISRTVWRCDSPHDGCPRLDKVALEPVNQLLNKSVPSPFKYIMFEGLAYHEQEILIGVRAFQDKKNGLTPWSLLSNLKGDLLLDARKPLQFEGKEYGMSGVSFDAEHQGFWITWSYEDEEGSIQESVKGILSFSPLKYAKNHKENPNKQAKSLEFGAKRLDHTLDVGSQICAVFQMKPEGVSVSEKGDLFVVFDEDLDRKDAETFKDTKRFALQDNQDFIYQSTTKALLKQ
ncbi:MAG: hypothetical protein CMH49_07400 [Myxococcales bacterium]|nr:hypothetical protein [Myxococcales bacterium]